MKDSPKTCYGCGGPNHEYGVYCVACKMAHARDAREERRERKRRKKDRGRTIGQRLHDGFSYFQDEPDDNY